MSEAMILSHGAGIYRNITMFWMFWVHAGPRQQPFGSFGPYGVGWALGAWRKRTPPRRMGSRSPMPYTCSKIPLSAWWDSGLLEVSALAWPLAYPRITFGGTGQLQKLKASETMSSSPPMVLETLSCATSFLLPFAWFRPCFSLRQAFFVNLVMLRRRAE